MHTHAHSHTHTHTHTCIQTHTPTLSPTCLSLQSAFALLCSDTCSHSHLIISSIYSGCACGSLSDYCMSCIECGLLLVVDLRIRTLSCLAWSCWFSRCPAAASSESSSTRSLKTEVPRTRQSTVLFCDFPSSSVSTHDRLPCFCSFIKDCLD